MESSDPETSRAVSARRVSAFISEIDSDLSARDDTIAQRLRSQASSGRSRLTKIYVHVDELTRGAGPFVACARGCSACCHMNVSITDLEADRLAQASGRAPAKLSRAVKHELDEYIGVPCPFLKDGECSVYDARPFMCRQHLSFDESAYWCQPERSASVKLSLVSFGGATQAYADLVGSSRLRGVADIRDFFPQLTQT